MKVIYEFTDDDEHKRQMMDAAGGFYAALWEIRDYIWPIYRGKYDEDPPLEEVLDRIVTIIGESRMDDIP